MSSPPDNSCGPPRRQRINRRCSPGPFAGPAGPASMPIHNSATQRSMASCPIWTDIPGRSGMKERPGGLFGGMSIELGKVGIWRHPSGLTPELVADVAALGYGAIWVGGSPPGDLGFVE